MKDTNRAGGFICRAVCMTTNQNLNTGLLYVPDIQHKAGMWKELFSSVSGSLFNIALIQGQFIKKYPIPTLNGVSIHVNPQPATRTLLRQGSGGRSPQLLCALFPTPLRHYVTTPLRHFPHLLVDISCREAEFLIKCFIFSRIAKAGYSPHLALVSGQPLQGYG